MSKGTHEITIGEIDFIAHFNWYPGEPAITHLAPEDCDPGCPAEVEITEIYLDGTDVDLLPVIAESTIEDIQNILLEN